MAHLESLGIPRQALLATTAILLALPAMAQVATDGTRGARVSLTGPDIEVGERLWSRRRDGLHGIERNLVIPVARAIRRVSAVGAGRRDAGVILDDKPDRTTGLGVSLVWFLQRDLRGGLQLVTAVAFVGPDHAPLR